MIGQVSVAAATAIVGYDCFTNEKWNVSGRNRLLRGVAMAGSTAAGDCEADLFVGSMLITHLFNSATGFPLREHLKALGQIVVPAGSKISCIITNAAVGNPINFDLF